MLKSKKDSLTKLIQRIDDERIIDSIQEVLDSHLFAEVVAKRAGLTPIWVVFEIHVSMQGNKYRTGILEAFKTKKALADFLLNISMTNQLNRAEPELVFIEQGSKFLFYSTVKNNLNYFNFGEIYLNESATVDKTSENRTIERIEIKM